MANSGIWKRVSWGVTAGDTRGVNVYIESVAGAQDGVSNSKHTASSLRMWYL